MTHQAGCRNSALRHVAGVHEPVFLHQVDQTAERGLALVIIDYHDLDDAGHRTLEHRCSAQDDLPLEPLDVHFDQDLVLQGKLNSKVVEPFHLNPHGDRGNGVPARMNGGQLVGSRQERRKTRQGGNGLKFHGRRMFTEGIGIGMNPVAGLGRPACKQPILIGLRLEAMDGGQRKQALEYTPGVSIEGPHIDDRSNGSSFHAQQRQPGRLDNPAVLDEPLGPLPELINFELHGVCVCQS